MHDRGTTRDIIRALGSACPPTVGLFLDEDPATVRHVVREGGLQYAQLCGSESPDYCSELSIPYWKVVNLHSAADYDRLPPYIAAAAFVLEGADNGPGGTGQTWDWELASGAPRDRPALIAGGLSPDNVSAAIKQARPWGVDVSSGVETGGTKDPDKIAAFIRRPKSVHLHARKFYETTRGVNTGIASGIAARSLRLRTLSTGNESAATPQGQATLNLGGSAARVSRPIHLT